MDIQRLHAALAKVAPIVGVSIAKEGDRKTWRIDFDKDATDAQIVKAHEVLGAWAPNAVLPEDLQAEAQRRIVELVGAKTFEKSVAKQMNALMRAAELNNKLAEEKGLTSEESAEAAQLKAMASTINAIRAASNAMEDNPPDDYTNDKHWPTAA